MITQRMLPTSKPVNSSTASVIWGDAEDGVLNGGTAICVEINNTSGEDLTVTILVKATRDSVLIPNALTVAAPNAAYTRLDLVGVCGYAAQLKAVMDAGANGDVIVSVQVQVP